jgi:hypothetical protein
MKDRPLLTVPNCLPNRAGHVGWCGRIENYSFFISHPFRLLAILLNRRGAKSSTYGKIVVTLKGGWNSIYDCLFLCVRICLPISMGQNLYIYFSGWESSVYLSLQVRICLPISMGPNLSTYLYGSESVYLFLWVRICLFISMGQNLSLYLYGSESVSLSLWVRICLSISMGQNLPLYLYGSESVSLSLWVRIRLQNLVAKEVH